MNISKFRGDLSPQRPVRACHGAALALALAGCASPLSFTPPQANAAASQANALATIQPQGGAMIPVGFYLDNYTNASVPFYSTVSCGMNPLDVKRGMLTSQQSLWIGGFWSGCLLGINPGYVTIHVGLQSQQCSFVIQANESGWFKSVGSDCQVMFLPKGPFKRGRDGGQMFQNLIYGGSAGRSNSTAPLAASRALRPAPSQGARIRMARTSWSKISGRARFITRRLSTATVSHGFRPTALLLQVATK
jgi:hypothetical protein